MTKPCIKCGSAERTPRGDCRACAIASAKAWRTKNAARVAAYNAAYKRAHAEEAAPYNKKYWVENKTALTEKQRNKRLAAPEKYRAQEALRYAHDKDAAHARVAEWYARNPGKKKQHNAANPEARRRSNNNRRARRAAVGGTLSNGLAQRLYIEQRGLCACCARPLNGRYHLDHIMPLALGGANVDSNIQLLLPRCNLQKKDKHPDVFKALRAQKN